MFSDCLSFKRKHSCVNILKNADGRTTIRKVILSHYAHIYDRIINERILHKPFELCKLTLMTVM